MKKIWAFLRLLFFGKERRPLAEVYFGGGGGGGYTAVGHTPEKPAQVGFCLDLLTRRQSTRPTPRPRPATANYPEPPKMALVVGDTTSNSIIFCKENSNGYFRV